MVSEGVGTKSAEPTFQRSQHPEATHVRTSPGGVLYFPGVFVLCALLCLTFRPCLSAGGGSSSLIDPLIFVLISGVPLFTPQIHKEAHGKMGVGALKNPTLQNAQKVGVTKGDRDEVLT